MSGAKTLSTWVPDGTGIWASRDAHLAGEAPVARLLTRFPVNTAWGRRQAYHIRAVTPDGTYWSGRSSGGGPIVVLRSVRPGTPLFKYLSEYHPVARTRPGVAA